MVGPIQFTLVWKFPIILILFLFVLLFPNLKKSSLFFIGMLFSIKYVLYPYWSFNIVLDIIELVKYSVIPLFADSFAFFLARKKRILNVFPTYLAIGVILSSIPFLLGILTSFEDAAELEQELSIYGGGGKSAFVGGFGGPHNAAVSMTGSVLYLIALLQPIKKRFSFRYVFVVGVIFLGLMVIYQTYVRTGYVCLLVGLLYLYLWNKKLVYYVKLFPIFLLVTSLLVIKVANDPILILKLTDQTVNSKRSKKKKSMDKIGSGRGLIWRSAVANWKDSPAINMILGNGMNKSLELMGQSEVGAPLVSHNGILDVLQHTGLLGLSLYLFFVGTIYKYARKARDEIIKKKLISLIIVLIISFIFQGGHFFWLDCLLAFTLAQCIVEKREINEFNKKSIIPIENRNIG
jgi:O-antigen ligase